MLNRDPMRERPRTKAGAERERERAFRERLSLFKRVYRWLNLTLIQLGTWPLLVALAIAPALPLPLTPMPWYLVRLAAPALAALLALVYLAQRPESLAGAAGDPPMPRGAMPPLRQQAAFLLPGLAIALSLARLAIGPPDAALKALLFGIADTAAYQVIHFGVVRRSWPDEDSGNLAAVGFFTLSWAIREAIAAAATPAQESLWMAAFAGGAIGLVIGGASLVLRRWPGGWLPAASAQLVISTLIFAAG
ncbi:MAG: hypothetical protein ACKOWF_10940 [Chloroflexota bacterium]